MLVLTWRFLSAQGLQAGIACMFDHALIHHGALTCPLLTTDVGRQVLLPYLTVPEVVCI